MRAARCRRMNSRLVACRRQVHLRGLPSPVGKSSAARANGGRAGVGRVGAGRLGGRRPKGTIFNRQPPFRASLTSPGNLRPLAPARSPSEKEPDNAISPRIPRRPVCSAFSGLECCSQALGQQDASAKIGMLSAQYREVPRCSSGSKPLSCV